MGRQFESKVRPGLLVLLRENPQIQLEHQTWSGLYPQPKQPIFLAEGVGQVLPLLENSNLKLPYQLLLGRLKIC